MASYSNNNYEKSKNGYKTYDAISDVYEKKNFGRNLISQVFFNCDKENETQLSIIESKISSIMTKPLTGYTISNVTNEIVGYLNELKPHLLGDYQFDKKFISDYVRNFFRKFEMYNPLQETKEDEITVLKDTQDKNKTDEESEDESSNQGSEEDEEDEEDDEESEEESDEEDESEEEDIQLVVEVEEKNNPCVDSYYDPNRIEFKYTYEQESLIAIRKGTCFKCSAYRPILYTNLIYNLNCSQLCERCITEMFGDARN